MFFSIAVGIETGSGSTPEIIRAALYAFVGIVIAVPIAFTVNITRNEHHADPATARGPT
jgi:hypothetical protein